MRMSIRFGCSGFFYFSSCGVSNSNYRRQVIVTFRKVLKLELSVCIGMRFIIGIAIFSGCTVPNTYFGIRKRYFIMFNMPVYVGFPTRTRIFFAGEHEYHCYRCE